MNWGNNLFQVRKKQGLSPEKVAEKLGVSQQIVSKWETDETLPDIRQAKRLAALYHLSGDSLCLIWRFRRFRRRSSGPVRRLRLEQGQGEKYPLLIRYQEGRGPLLRGPLSHKKEALSAVYTRQRCSVRFRMAESPAGTVFTAAPAAFPVPNHGTKNQEQHTARQRGGNQSVHIEISFLRQLGQP